MSSSPFVMEWMERVARRVERPARALDLATGTGRHTGAIARAGFRTFGVDVSFDAVRSARNAAAPYGTVAVWCADLRRCPLPRARFELIVVTRYLQRDLFGAIAEALAPGGFVVYETFTIAQRLHGRGPTSPDHLLQPGELRRAFDSLDVLFYEEVTEPDAVARLVGRRDPVGLPR
jgi:SAM-dependent methyltransferase